MLRRYMFVSFIIPIALLGGCSDMLSDARRAGHGARVPVSFTLDAESFVAFPTPPAVMPASDGIMIEGHLALPVACATAGATADRESNTVRVVVSVTREAQSAGTACPTAVRDAQYRASVTLPPSTYHVVLIHQLLGAATGSEIVFEGDVAVP